MPRGVSSEGLGEAFGAIMNRRDLSALQVSLLAKGRISPSYVNHIRLGRVPSYDVLLVLREALGSEEVDPLFALAGYPGPPKIDLALPPGAVRLVGSARLPVAPRISAATMEGVSPDHHTTEVDVREILSIAEGDYLLQVHGDCLEPRLRDGDWVLMRPAHSARSGSIVVARTGPDTTREPGCEFTLKIWRAGRHAGFYTANGEKVLEAHHATIIAKFVCAIVR